MNPEYTVSLRICDDSSTLYYRAAAVDRSGDEVVGFAHSSENYNEALACAKVYFEELARSTLVASYIEQPGKLIGQGAFYDIGRFAIEMEEIITDDEFYDQLAQEFLEKIIHNQKSHINVIFRRIVERHKLDLYKENKLLAYLQTSKIVEAEKEEDTETWLKRQLKVYDERT